jgi:hypothetical protein
MISVMKGFAPLSFTAIPPEGTHIVDRRFRSGWHDLARYMAKYNIIAYYLLARYVFSSIALLNVLGSYEPRYVNSP